MASSIVKSAAQQMGNLVVEEAKFLYKVQGKIEKLQTELEWIECFLEDADNKQHQDKLVRKWVSQIIAFAYEAEDILERYLHLVPRQGGIWNTTKWSSKLLCACRVKTLHDLGVDVDKLIDEISDLNKRLRRYGVHFMRPIESLYYDAVMREQRRTYSHEEEVVVGLEKDVQQVVDLLMKKEVKVISISGMGGLGKSTLARKVFLDKDVRKHFGNNCVWVYISENFDRRSVFEEILIGLNVSSDDEGAKNKIKMITDDELPGRIYDLIHNKKCLVVLDDMWTTEAWNSLEPALGSIRSSSCSSKILLSTRKQELLHYVDPNGYPHDLKPLDDENSWKLLQWKAFPQKRSTGDDQEATLSEDTTTDITTITFDVEENTKKEKLGRRMLKHCHGLPLAIIALGGILSSRKTSAEWEEVQKNISAYLMASMGKSGGILRVLELSYHDLPFYLKPCFLYLANFPEDFEISTEKLYHLWEAEGILANLTNDETDVEGVTSYEIGEGLLLGLIQRSMVQVGKRWESGRIKSCRVHDLMRDMCVKKCKETSFLDVLDLSVLRRESIFSEGCVKRNQIYRCAFHEKAKGVTESRFGQYAQQMKVSHVRSVLVFTVGSGGTTCEREDLSKIIKTFPLLRVLHFQDRFYSESKIVEFEHLIHLRHLSLLFGFKQKLSSQLWGLKYVITLDLRGVITRMEFSNKFHQMERLKHLYLPSFYGIKDGK